MWSFRKKPTHFPSSAATSVTPGNLSDEEKYIEKWKEELKQQTAMMEARQFIAQWVLGISIGAVAVVSIVTINSAENKEQASKDVMISTLPLYGTWVGTILAFYFSSTAFQAAAAASDRNAERNIAVFREANAAATGTQLLGEQRLKQKSVKELANNLILSRKYDDSETLDTVVKDLKEKGRWRLLIVNDDKSFFNILYRRAAQDFLSDPGKRKGADGNDISLREYLEKTSENKAIVAFVSEESSLYDAKQAMDAVPGCTDVIVTTNGESNAPVVVYITDNDIRNNA